MVILILVIPEKITVHSKNIVTHIFDFFKRAYGRSERIHTNGMKNLTFILRHCGINHKIFYICSVADKHCYMCGKFPNHYFFIAASCRYYRHLNACVFRKIRNYTVVYNISVKVERSTVTDSRIENICGIFKPPFGINFVIIDPVIYFVFPILFPVNMDYIRSYVRLIL